MGSGTGDNIDVPLSVSPSTVVGEMKHPLARDLSGYLNIPAGQGVFGGSRMGRMDGGNSEKQPLSATDTSLAGGGSRTLGGGETRKQAPANHGLRNRVLTWLGIGGAAATAAVGGAAAAGSGALGPEAKQAYNDVFGVPTTVTVEAPTQPAVTENPDGSVTATQGGVETTVSPATETPAPTDAPTETSIPKGAMSPEALSALNLQDNLPIKGVGVLDQSAIPDAVIQSFIANKINGSVGEERASMDEYSVVVAGYFVGFEEVDGVKVVKLGVGIDKSGNPIQGLDIGGAVFGREIWAILDVPDNFDHGYNANGSTVVFYGMDQSVSEANTVSSTSKAVEGIDKGQKIVLIGGKPNLSSESSYGITKYAQGRIPVCGTEGPEDGRCMIVGAGRIIAPKQ